MVEEKKIIDLQSTIADALFIAHNKIRKTNITIVNEIKPNTYFTIGCPNKLEQVFVNLITNACDAMASISERKLCFSIQEHNKNGTLLWKCDVADTGKGIPVEIQKDIFQSFYTTKEKDKGTGLGLSIARGIVSEHGGEIEVKSEVNKGSTFSVYLPICNSVY